MNKQFSFSNVMVDLDAGLFDKKVSAAVKAVAQSVVDYGGKGGKKGKVVIELEFNRIGEAAQVSIKHTVKKDQPTMRGKTTDQDTTETPMYVGSKGEISIFQNTGLRTSDMGMSHTEQNEDS